MKYKAILFDMDGVLIESEFLMRASAIHALAQYGIEAKHEDFVEFTGMGEDKFVGGVAEKYGHTYTFDMKEKAYEMGVSKDFDPFITLSFMALTVIPELRITPRGLFRVSDKGSGFIK